MTETRKRDQVNANSISTNQQAPAPAQIGAALQWALSYAAAGWAVFPCHSMRNGACSCGDTPCTRKPAKHPRTSNGHLAATTDPQQIRAWWAQWPDANIGLRPSPGVIVVDVDPRNGGEASCEALDLPHTQTIQTGSGGWHFYYSVPAELSFPANAKKLGLSGIDLKGRNGYVLAPPSSHESGGAYTVLESVPIAPAPAWLLSLGYSPEAAGDWSAFDGPAEPTPALNHAAVVALLASCCVEGEKHNVAKAIGGILKKGGYTTGDAALIIRALPFNDPESRLRAALHVFGFQNPGGWVYFKAGLTPEAFAQLSALVPDVRPPDPGIEAFRAHVQSSGPAAEPAPAQCSDRFACTFIEEREYEAIDVAVLALANSPAIYQRGGLLVHIARDLTPAPETSKPSRKLRRVKDAHRIAEVSTPRLREEIGRQVMWFRRGNKGGAQPCAVPAVVVDGVEARDEWAGVRGLHGLTECPLVMGDGSIVSAEGYDLETGVYVAQACDVQVPELSPAECAQWVLDELAGEFPFASLADRSAFLAALLTPIARYAFSGPVPLFLFDKNTPGSGGSLLADLIGIVCTGRELPRMSQETDEYQEKNRLLGLAVEGKPIVLIDNINQPLGSAPLDMALTGTSIQGRWLGGNKIVTAPWNCMLIATGNNIQLVGDTVRRALRARLDSAYERPEERTGFRHPKIKDWAQANRGKLLGALLRILSVTLRTSAHPAIKPWGSFEGWSEVVRGAVVGCGLTDPLEARSEIVANDSSAQKIRGLIQGIASAGATSRDTALTVKELLQKAGPAMAPTSSQPLIGVPTTTALRDALEEIDPKLDPGNLGRAFGRLRGRVIGDMRLESVSAQGGKQRWHVAQGAKPAA